MRTQPLRPLDSHRSDTEGNDDDSDDDGSDDGNNNRADQQLSGA
jgi:hypothetical protein